MFPSILTIFDPRQSCKKLLSRKTMHASISETGYNAKEDIVQYVYLRFKLVRLDENIRNFKTILKPMFIE